MTHDLIPSDRLLLIALDRYLAGSASDAENAMIAQWFAAEPGARTLVEELRAMPAGVGAPASFETRALAGRIEAALDMRSVGADRRETHDISPKRAGRRLQFGGTPLLRRSLWYAVGSAMLGAFLFVAGWQGERRQADVRMPGQVFRHQTDKGQRATVMLPDGSTVMLNVASQIEISRNYMRGDRTVRLNGEALFTVVPRRDAPFTVIAGSSTARVLGTSFLVRHYATDTATTVAVRDGKVAVHSVVLVAGEEVKIGRHHAGRVTSAEPAQFSFARGVLTLHTVPLSEAIVELSRWYDADIRLGDPVLASRHITGDYEAGPLTDLTESLALAFNVRVVRDGRTVTLFPR